MDCRPRLSGQPDPRTLSGTACVSLPCSLSHLPLPSQAVFTRQNNNGDRHGYECPEERDYYPYWHPSPWRDIAILTNDVSWCPFYLANSQNTQNKNFCLDTAGSGTKNQWNNEVECLQNNGIWASGGAWNIPAPKCQAAPFSSDNLLGNGMTGSLNNFTWTLPTASELSCIASDNCNCVLRIRYNISTGDLGANGNRPDANFIDWTQNDPASPITNNQFSSQDGNSFRLAMDTTQFGRTFQDRCVRCEN